MASDPGPPPKPPAKLESDPRNRKVIFFTLDTLFNREYAIECGLRKCKELNRALARKTLDELKSAYRDAINGAFRQHILSQLHGPSVPQMDKVGLLFQHLNLNIPSADERRLLGSEFAAEFNRNRFEAVGASELLVDLKKKLNYDIVVVDHSCVCDWGVVKHLKFWHHVDAMILTEDLVARKPDPRVFTKALDECNVPAKGSVIVGRSVEDDIRGIIDVGADPILYMPGHRYRTMDVKDTTVQVVPTMAELSSKIQIRPENSQFVTPGPLPRLSSVLNPVHPPMFCSPQNQGHPNGQNGGPSTPHHYRGPTPDPEPAGDGQASQSRKRTRPSLMMPEPRPVHPAPVDSGLPYRDRSIRKQYRERSRSPYDQLPPRPRRDETRSGHGYVPQSPMIAPGTRSGHGYVPQSPMIAPRNDLRPLERGDNDPASRSSPGPSTQSYAPSAPTPATEVPTSSGQYSFRVTPDSNSPEHSSGSSTSRVTLPPITSYPLTRDYGISIRSHSENRYQLPPPYHGYGHGASRDRYPTQAMYPPPPPPPPIHPHQSPILNQARYQDQAEPRQGGHGYDASRDRYTDTGGYPPPPPPPSRSLYQPPAPSNSSYQDQTVPWREWSEYGASDNRDTMQGGYQPGPSNQRQRGDSALRDIARRSLNGTRDIRRADSSPKDVDEQTRDMAGRQ